MGRRTIINTRVNTALDIVIFSKNIHQVNISSLQGATLQCYFGSTYESENIVNNF